MNEDILNVPKQDVGGEKFFRREIAVRRNYYA